jgi:hypothetical protein
MNGAWPLPRTRWLGAVAAVLAAGAAFLGFHLDREMAGARERVELSNQAIRAAESILGAVSDRGSGVRQPAHDEAATFTHELEQILRDGRETSSLRAVMDKRLRALRSTTELSRSEAQGAGFASDNRERLIAVISPTTAPPSTISPANAAEVRYWARKFRATDQVVETMAVRHDGSIRSLARRWVCGILQTNRTTGR